MAPANPELRELIREMNGSRLAERFRKEKDGILEASGEVFPSAILPVLACNKAGEERVFPMKWGFSQNGKLLINARTETAAMKPTFRESWQKHRCVIPVSWYYEWEHDENKKPGRKYALQPKTGGLVMLAGLYRMEEEIPAFVILTRPAHEDLLWMHDRMPVAFSGKDAKMWIRPDITAESIIRNCITDMTWKTADDDPKAG